MKSELKRSLRMLAMLTGVLLLPWTGAAAPAQAAEKTAPKADAVEKIPASPLGIVTQSQLSVRAGMGTGYTEIGKLEKKNPVTITAANKKWLEIRLPENCGVWVQKQYLVGGKFTANVNLRSGPGIGYESLGIGRKGIAAETKGVDTPSGWVMIKPFLTLKGYVPRNAVKVEESQLKNVPVLVDKKMPLPDKDLIALEGNYSSPGKKVTVSGWVDVSGSSIKALTHVLYVEKGNKLEPAAFLAPGKLDMKRYNDQQVKVSGIQYSVKGWDLPVIMVQIVNAVPEK